MFDGANKVCVDPFALLSGFAANAFIDKSFAFSDLVQLDYFGISPFSVAVLLIKFHCLLVIAWNLHSVHAYGFRAE